MGKSAPSIISADKLRSACLELDPPNAVIIAGEAELQRKIVRLLLPEKVQ